MSFIQSVLRLCRLFMAITLLTGLSGSGYAEAALSSPRAPTLPNGHLKTPMYFEVNRGQTDASVKFFTRAGGYNLYLTGSEAVLVIPGTAAAGRRSGVVRMKLKGANASPSARGLEILPGRTSYFIGSDPSKWQTGVEQYAKVKFGQVYPGIDMVYRFDKGSVEYDFVVAPGANPGRILMGFEGAEALRLNTRGDLVLRAEGGELTYKAPRLYQVLDNRRVPVTGRYVLTANSHARFEVGNYIKSKELVIDPSLAYSSFLGGAEEDYANAIAVDNAGNAYLTGTTTSAAFPTAGTQNLPLKTGTAVKVLSDVFVTKVNPAGTAKLWSVYFGGSGNDVVRGIAVDGATHRIFVAGDTTASADFPYTALVGTGVGTGGGNDAFVARIDDAGGTSPTLAYANVFGGGFDDFAYGIAIDGADNVYVTGTTQSLADNTFPVYPALPLLSAAQPHAGAGATQSYVVKFSAALAQVYGTYLGGAGETFGYAIAVDSARNAYVTGRTEDAFLTASDWPNVFKNTVSGANDAFIAELNPAGSSYLYKTYIGGSGINIGTAIAVDGASPANVYIAGYTYSGDFPGPGLAGYDALRLGGAQTTPMSGNPAAFVFKLRTAMTGATDGVYSTYFGRSGDTRATAIAVDSAGQAYVTGTNTGGDIPAIGGSAFQGSPDAFVVQLDNTGGSFKFMTYLGGTTQNYAMGLALDSAKNIYVAGYTSSDAATFPLVAGGFQQARGGGTYDAFITKIGKPALPPACTITGINPASGFTVGGTTVTINIANFPGFGGLGVTFDGIAALSYKVNTASTVVTAITPAHSLGSVPLVVKAITGTCSPTTYNYVVAACGKDRFFPSPATGATASFAYCMALPGTVKIRVYNVVGDLVAKLEDARAGGPQLSQLNTARLAPGVYLYRLEKDYGGGNTTTSDVKKFVVKH